MKRILAIMLSLVLVISSLPSVVFAANENNSSGVVFEATLSTSQIEYSEEDSYVARAGDIVGAMKK